MKTLIILNFVLCSLAISSNAARCDMKLDKRALVGGINLWPEGIVPYKIDSEFSEDHKQSIVAGLEEITTRTENCIRFVEYTEEHSNWVNIVDKSGCWVDTIGMKKTPGSQQLSLHHSGCVTRDTIIHETMHALGFNHEQIRTDRDQYVKILYENIDPDFSSNFDKAQNTGVEIPESPYDYMSVMHYYSNGFSLNGLPTITPALKIQRKWRYKMGRPSTASDADIYRIRKVYGCI
ncbi:hypothetical protein I4U23_028604 [Adineta vaga]|nr:hypothetical protein I4U23_028604 [Adineta vaga]